MTKWQRSKPRQFDTRALSNCYTPFLFLIYCMCVCVSIPMDCSPPGSSVHGILQACTLLHSICSNSGCVCVCVCVCRGGAMDCSPPGSSVHGLLLHCICSPNSVCVCVLIQCGWGSQWTAAHQALLSMGFSRHEHWGGLPLPSPPNLLNISYMRSPVVVKS